MNLFASLHKKSTRQARSQGGQRLAQSDKAPYRRISHIYVRSREFFIAHTCSLGAPSPKQAMVLGISGGGQLTTHCATKTTPKLA